MLGTIKGRIAVIVIVCGIMIAGLVNTYMEYGTPVKLGLDLQGGMHLALEIDDPDGTMTPEARADAIDQNLHVLRNRIGQFGVEEPLIQKSGSDRIIVELPGIQDEERAKEIIERQAFLEWKLVLPTELFVQALPRLDRLIAANIDPDSLEAVPVDTATIGEDQELRDRLFGRADSASADSASADSVQARPGITRQPLSSILLQAGPGEFYVREQDVARVKIYLSVPGVSQAMPRAPEGGQSELRWANAPEAIGADLYRSLYFLEREPFITGQRLRGSTALRDPQFNKTVVTFELDRRGGREFERVTSAHIGDRIAIVLDTLVHSAPEVISTIGANGQIDMGQAPMEEASDLALVLRAGALQAPLAILEQRSVGPALGQDSIDQGKIAGIIGILLVVTIMIVYYRLSGALAVAALALYVILVLGGLSAINATLTAPGIAGFILSLGMAVDANVLIFERIREEIAAGRSTRVASDEGFKAAMSAIIDSNLTTLITALILYQIGTGPVRGFAVTLSIGILASFFTAVYITRTFFLIYLDRKRPAEPISI
jgi:preprotein translocase subunit SecD